MSIASTGNLIDVLRENGLLGREQLDQLPTLAQGRCGEARALAKLLVQRGWLTVFQINQVLFGNAHKLVIGPYNVLDRLGEGGLSSVYKARHYEHGWTVALKLLQPEVIASSAGRRQFLLEMEAMARLDHPNIVQFCDAGEHGETFFYAMEYIEGTDLGKYTRLCGQLPIAEACDFIRQAALGLQHAHERNLVHRDIKPVNLYLTQPQLPAPTPWSAREGPHAKKTPLVKILDWGLASLRCPSGFNPAEGAENLAKGVIGTADYLSPEQARNAQEVDIRGDIYSLGCTLYFLFTGQPPFPQGTLVQKLMAHQGAEPTPVDQFRDDIPVEVALILKRMLAKQPEKRFQTPAALALALLPFARSGSEVAGQEKKPRSIAASPRGTSIADPTPLPITLTGHPKLARLPKAGPMRPAYTEMDTSAPR